MNWDRDKQEADRLFHELMAKKPEAQKVASADGMSVAEVCDKFLDWCNTHRESRTYSRYLDFIQDFVDSLQNPETIPVKTLKPFHVIEWVDKHNGWNDTTKRNAIVHLLRPFNWAEKLGYIASNPLKHIEKPRAKRRDNPITSNDFAAIISLVKDRPFLDLLHFAWETGCRPQEARLIEIRHINRQGKRIEFPPQEAKGKKRWRIIRLTDKALEIVERLATGKTEGILFLNTDGNPWKIFAICNRFSRLKKKLGRGFAAYDIRHGFCQRMLENGVNHLAVAEIMGHANGQMVSAVYSHMNRADDHLCEALNKASASNASN